MIKLLFIAFLLSSCTNNQSTNTTSLTNTVTITNYVSIQKPIASYDKGDPNLIRVFSDFGSWYRYQFRNDTGEYDPSIYKGVYWDPTNNRYYTTYIYETNNIEYSLDTNLMYEPVYFDIFEDSISDLDMIPYSEDFIKEGTTTTNLLGNGLLYVGSISPLERVYIDSLNKELFIKLLRPVLYRYVDSNGITNITNSRPTPVYPALPFDFGYFIFEMEYTNSKGQIIYIETDIPEDGSDVIHDYDGTYESGEHLFD